ncbi:MAG: hypothetical protein WBO34_09410 [Gammaproteobacteria bacterium]
MKLLIKYFVTTLTLSTLFFGTASASGINVPGDFPGDFYMDILSGFANIDIETSHIGTFDLDTTSNQIPFTATSFTPDGTGAGISSISVANSAINIGSTLFFGMTMNFFLEGGGTGSLDDIDGTQGHWNLTMPLFADWNGGIWGIGDFGFSSAESYDYFGASGLTSISGDIMNYATGNTFLVGQATITDPDSPFIGIRVTLGLNGNDPVVAPVPAAVWLFGSGLVGLVGLARRKKSA